MAEALDEGALEVTQIDSLIDSQFKPKSSAARETIQKSISTLARQALKEGEVDPADPTATIKFIIKSLDDKLSAQVNQIIHHEDFQRLEGSWRGLQYMVANTETDEQLKIRVLNISKKEIGKVLKKYKGTAWEQSPLFKKMYEEEYGTPAASPLAASWVTMNSITAPRTWRYFRACPRWRPRPTRPSLPPLLPS